MDTLIIAACGDILIKVSKFFLFLNKFFHSLTNI